MKTELETYLLQALNMALQINGETSYTNSFDVTVVDEGFYFIPRLPASYVIDDDLYQKIFQICNAALYPDYTMLKQTGAYFVPLDTEDIHVKRALFFPWTKRQQELYNDPNAVFPHHTIVIDELLALSEGVTKSIKDTFFSLLVEISLLGRATNNHLLLVSHRFSKGNRLYANKKLLDKYLDTSRVYAFFDNVYSFFKGCIFSSTVFSHEIYTFFSGIC